MKKIYLKQLLAAILLLCSSVVSAETYSGTCGANLNWLLNTESNVIHITGTGEMNNYNRMQSDAPWAKYRHSIKWIVIDEGVTSIGDAAFPNCSNLVDIRIPNSVTSIGYGAFSGCSNLANITIPSSVVSIGSIAFYKTAWYNNQPDGPIYLDNWFLDYKISDSATDVIEHDIVITEGTKGIADYAFVNDYGYGLTRVTMPNSLTHIGNFAFYHCALLESIEIPNSVINIGEAAFAECYNLFSVTIGNGVKSIGDAAFEYCFDLNSLTIGNSVTSIGERAFFECYWLYKITIPHSVTCIKEDAFGGCPLTSIEVAAENSVYDSRKNCNAIIETATNTLIVGGQNTWIPNSVTSIGKKAFYILNGEINIPSSVTNIGEYAFGYCNLTDIYFESNPAIASNGIPEYATCHLVLNDYNATDFNTANANRYADASYFRQATAGIYETIILPFTPDAASLEYYTFYTLKEVGEGYIRFEEETAPAANTPYLYTLREGGENTAITGGETTIAADINNCDVNGWDLVGSFSNQTIDCTTGNYYAYSAARNEINRITKTLTVSPFRAYLKSTAAQNSNLRVFIGGTTGVTEISPDDIEGFDNGAVYDLYGRPVNEPAKGGIYIINGEKVVW